MARSMPLTIGMRSAPTTAMYTRCRTPARDAAPTRFRALSSSPLEPPAQCTTVLTPATAASIASPVARSPVTNSTPSPDAWLCRLSTRTSHPASRRRGTTCPPSVPVPPVTRTRIEPPFGSDLLAGPLRLREGLLPRHIHWASRVYPYDTDRRRNVTDGRAGSLPSPSTHRLPGQAAGVMSKGGDRLALQGDFQQHEPADDGDDDHPHKDLCVIDLLHGRRWQVLRERSMQEPLDACNRLILPNCAAESVTR